MSILATRLKECRQAKMKGDKKWTQEYIAKKINISRVAYTTYENGSKQPPYNVLIRIADLYDVDVDFLLGRRNVPKIEHIGQEDVLSDINDLLWRLSKDEQYKIFKFIQLFYYEK